MGNFFKLLDSAISWGERLWSVRWIRYSILSAMTAAGAAWAYFSRLDGLIIFLAALGALAFALGILLFLFKLAPYLRGFLSPTIKVHVPLIHHASAFIVGDGSVSELTFEIHILNTSKSNHVNINLGRVIFGRPDDDNRHENLAVNAKNIKSDLGPQEDTGGLIIVYHVEKNDINKGITLVIEDRLTERILQMEIPGKYPKDHG